MDKICYKVVERSLVGNSYVSTSYVINNNKNYLIYNLGKTTYPKIGKIFVFDTYKHAEKFLYFFGADDILMGIAQSISYPKYASLRITDVERFWENKKNKKKVSDFSTNSFQGTIWCESFTPKEVIFSVEHKIIKGLETNG